MKGKWAIIVSLSVVLWVIAVLTWPERPGGPDSKASTNVVVILVDALRADHVGCYGYSRRTTPSLDDLARSSVLFTRAFSPSSWTKPSIPSLFTSLYPSRHGVFEGSSKDTRGFITSDVLSDSLVTMAELLRERGYRTAAFVHNAQLKGFLGFSQGFDDYRDGAGDAEGINAAFLEWLDSGGEGPVFAYLHYLDVHWPYQPPAPYDTLFGVYPSEIDFNTEEWKAQRSRINEGMVDLTANDLEKMISLYDGEIRYLDDELGRLFMELRSRGLYDNTLLIVTADHGESFFEHRKIGHGHDLHRELLWIPLIIRFPGGTRGGTRVGDPVELVDILPTVTDFLGMDPPAEIDGESLLRGIEAGRDRPGTAATAYSELLHKGEYQRALTGDTYKLVETYAGDFDRSGRSIPQINFRVGDRVEVDGVPGPGRAFIADKIELDDNQEDEDDEIEGPIDAMNRAEGTFGLMTLEVVLEPDAALDGIDGDDIGYEDLEEGMRIKANGRVRDGRRYEVDRVRMRENGHRDFTLEGNIDDVKRNGDGSVTVSLMGFRVEIDPGTAVEDAGAREADPVKLVRTELYDIANDPGESENLAGSNPEIAEEMRSLLRERYPSIVDRDDRRALEVRELDTQTIEELKAIGYVQ